MTRVQKPELSSFTAIFHHQDSCTQIKLFLWNERELSALSYYVSHVKIRFYWPVNDALGCNFMSLSLEENKIMIEANQIHAKSTP